MDIITRKEAQAQGLTHYFTGKPCKHGHLEKRFASSGQCTVCLANHDRRYRSDPKGARNQQSLANQNRKMRENPEFVAARREHARRHREAFKAIHGMSRTAFYYRNDPQYKAAHICRCRVRQMIRVHGGVKSSATFDLVGCTVQELMAHLEKGFAYGMTWENMGEWHIDHIVPCASFDLTDPEQQKACFHWSNLQPLWAEENIRKGAKLVA